MLEKHTRYSRASTIWFMVVFYICAALCAIPFVAPDVVESKEVLHPPFILMTVIGFAIVLPAALLIDRFVHTIRKLFFILIHIVVSCAVLFTIGAYQPMLSLWIVLAVLTYVEFGFIGLALSITCLFAACASFLTMTAILVEVPPIPIPYYIPLSAALCSVLGLTSYMIARILHRSETGRRELRALVNSIDETIVTLDMNAVVKLHNATALSFFDTNTSLVGQNLADILKLTSEMNEPIDIKEMVRSIKHPVVRDDVMIKDDEQGTIWLSLHVSPIYTANKLDGVVMVIRDITKQKTLDEEKEAFISVASHELRTPVAAAEGSLGNLMVMQSRGMNASKLAEAASTAHEQIVYLSDVVNELTTLSRVEQNVEEAIEAVDIRELYHDLFTKYEPQLAKKSLHLNLNLQPNLPVVYASKLYISEVLENLISNAIKYTKEGSITLKAERVGESVSCSVADTGIGVSKSDIKHLGERFFRSEDYRTRETGGTGLGLYVVKKLADKLGGELQIESRLNHGSVFSLNLPITAGNRESNEAK